MKRRITLVALLICALLPLTLFSACSGKNEKAVGSCGGYEILYEELRFQTLMAREDKPDASEEELRAAVEEALCLQYAVLQLCSEKMPNRSMDDEDIQAAVDEALESAIASQGGKSAYKKMLKERYLTKHLMNRMLTVAQMQLELEKVIYTGTELESSTAFAAWLNSGNFVRARRLFFPASMASAAEAADAARQALRAGDDVNTVLSADQKKLGATLYQPDYFFRGMNGSALEAAAFELATVGAASEVISTADGYHVLLRVSDEGENLMNYQLETAFEKYRVQRMDLLLAQAAETLRVEWNAYGAELRLSEIE